MKGYKKPHTPRVGHRRADPWEARQHRAQLAEARDKEQRRLKQRGLDLEAAA